MSDTTIPKTKHEILSGQLEYYLLTVNDISMGTDAIPSAISKSMDNYAKQQAVSFIEWAWNNGWQPYDAHDRWINTDQGNVVLPTPSVYESFLIAQTKSKQ
jgi:hypothetical protein